MSGPENNANEYPKSTLFMAALIFISFSLLIYFLPVIMLAVGGQNRWISGSVVAAVLVLPFVGLWLRGKKRADKPK